MGNHEDNFLTYVQACIDGEQGKYWLGEPFFAGGGLITLQSYSPGLRQPADARLIEAIPPEHLAFMSQLPLSWQDDTYLLVHAGVRPGIPLAQQCENDLLRIRRPFLFTSHGLDKCVVFGHTPFREVWWEADKIGIDTGACFDVAGYGKLTGLCLQTQQIFQTQ
jgi:serine/threonine protein phosphatase 1